MLKLLENGHGRKIRGLKKSDQIQLLSNLGKRPLIDVAILEGTPKDIMVGDKKRKQDVVEMTNTNNIEQKVVLDDQHRQVVGPVRQ